jgi:hypothetical protein
MKNVTRPCSCCMEEKTGVEKPCKTAQCSYIMCDDCVEKLLPNNEGFIMCPQCRYVLFTVITYDKLSQILGYWDT